LVFNQWGLRCGKMGLKDNRIVFNVSSRLNYTLVSLNYWSNDYLKKEYCDRVSYGKMVIILLSHCYTVNVLINARIKCALFSKNGPLRVN